MVRMIVIIMNMTCLHFVLAACALQLVGIVDSSGGVAIGHLQKPVACAKHVKIAIS